MFLKKKKSLYKILYILFNLKLILNIYPFKLNFTSVLLGSVIDEF